MSVPAVGTFDVKNDDGQALKQFGDFGYFNNRAIGSLAFGIDQLDNTSKIDFMSFDFVQASSPLAPVAPLPPKAGIILIETDFISLLRHNGTFHFLSDQLKGADVLAATGHNDTLLISSADGAKIIDLGNGNDMAVINGRQTLTVTGGGTDTVISTDDKADLVFSVKPYGDAGQSYISVSAGSLVIAGENDIVKSSTGNDADITRMTREEFGKAMVENPIEFLNAHSNIEKGLLFAAFDEFVTSKFYLTGSYQLQVEGSEIKGLLIPFDSDINALMTAYRQTLRGEYIEAMNTLDQRIEGMNMLGAYDLVKELAGTFDAENANLVPVPMWYDTSIPAGGIPGVETPFGVEAAPAADQGSWNWGNNCTAYATYEQFGYPEENVQVTGHSTAYTPEIF